MDKAKLLTVAARLQPPAPEAGVGGAVASLLQPAPKSTVRGQVKINSAISPLAWAMGSRVASGAGA